MSLTHIVIKLESRDKQYKWKIIARFSKYHASGDDKL